MYNFDRVYIFLADMKGGMSSDNIVLSRMQQQLQSWEEHNDARLIFLTCYQMMTTNVLAAIANQTFEDNIWVKRLMENFAEVYFQALQHYERQETCPQVWKVAFSVSPLSKAHAIQNLLLGVNAHINYDLVFVLAQLLQEEWNALSSPQRQLRYRDHCRINTIIYETIDSVQDQVIERFSPHFDIIDRLMGPLDEWLTAKLIAEWRDEVWNLALALLEEVEESQVKEMSQKIERQALQKTNTILLMTGGFNRI